MSFYKMDPAAWDFGTANLTLEQEAAYLRIVNAIHKHCAPVPDNDRVLAGLFRCSTRKARALVLALIEAGKLTIEDGSIWNDRARSDLVQRGFVSISRAESGAKGGRTRADNAAKALEKKEPAQAIASSREEKRREEKNNPPTPRKRGQSDDEDFERFWSAYPRKVAKPAALRAWLSAVKRDDRETIIAASPRAGDGGQFTPHPATWLNQDRWKDQPSVKRDDHLAAWGIRDLDGGSDEPSGNFSTRKAQHSARPVHQDDLSCLLPHTAQETRPVLVSELFQ